MKNAKKIPKLVIHKDPLEGKKSYSSFLMYDQTRDLLQQMKEETGRSMNELVHMSVVFAIKHMWVVEEQEG